MNDLSFLILIALISIGIGFALGSLVTGSRGDRLDAGSAKPAAPANLIQIAGIMTDRGGKTVYLQVEGKVIRSAGELSREQRTRLRQYIETIASWFGTPLTSPRNMGARRRFSTLANKEMEEAGSVEGFAMEAAGSTLAEGKRPRMNPVDVLARALSSDVGVPPPPAKSIVAQIDEILQELLKGTAQENRGIRLMELPGKGMVVMVGLNQYQGVDEVPDEEIRGLIRSAVSEWENRVSQ